MADSTSTSTYDPRSKWTAEVRRQVTYLLWEAQTVAERSPSTVAPAHNSSSSIWARNAVDEMLEYIKASNARDRTASWVHLARIGQLFQDSDGQKPYLWSDIGPEPEAFTSLILVSDFTALPIETVDDTRARVEELKSMAEVLAPGCHTNIPSSEHYDAALDYLGTLSGTAEKLRRMATKRHQGGSGSHHRPCPTIMSSAGREDVLGTLGNGTNVDQGHRTEKDRWAG